MPGQKGRGAGVSLRRTALWGLLAAVSMGRAALADATVVPAAQDATLIEDPQGSLATGSGPAIFAGRIASTLQALRRGLVRFDVASAVPAGSTIDAVRLRLNLSMAASGPVTVRLHRVTQSWGEGASSSFGGNGVPSEPGDATWIHRFHDDVFWTQPGGDFDPVARGEAPVDQTGPYAWDSTPEMVEDVQSWLDDPTANFGWMLIGDEDRLQTARRFDSRENPDPLVRPALEVLYTTPCLPDPAGPGFWRQACGESLDEAVSTCAAATFTALGLPEIDSCSAVLAPAPPSCNARAARKLAVLVLNLCANRLQTSCPVSQDDSVCRAEDVGGQIEAMAALLAAGDCRRAAACGGLLE